VATVQYAARQSWASTLLDPGRGSDESGTVELVRREPGEDVRSGRTTHLAGEGGSKRAVNSMSENNKTEREWTRRNGASHL